MCYARAYLQYDTRIRAGRRSADDRPLLRGTECTSTGAFRRFGRSSVVPNSARRFRARETRHPVALDGKIFKTSGRRSETRRNVNWIKRKTGRNKAVRRYRLTRIDKRPWPAYSFRIVSAQERETRRDPRAWPTTKRFPRTPPGHVCAIGKRHRAPIAPTCTQFKTHFSLCPSY